MGKGRENPAPTTASAAMRPQLLANKVVEETTTGDPKLKETVAGSELLFSGINVNHHATEFKFDNVYGCRRLLNDDIMCATEALISPRLPADAGMRTRVTLAFSVILVLVCSLSTVPTSAPYRRVLRCSRWRPLRAPCLR